MFLENKYPKKDYNLLIKLNVKNDFINHYIVSILSNMDAINDAFRWAVINDKVELIDILIRKGANINIDSGFALKTAIKQKNGNMIKVLRKNHFNFKSISKKIQIIL
jgi:ankyrin repeat protein